MCILRRAGEDAGRWAGKVPCTLRDDLNSPLQKQTGEKPKAVNRSRNKSLRYAKEHYWKDGKKKMMWGRREGNRKGKRREKSRKQKVRVQFSFPMEVFPAAQELILGRRDQQKQAGESLLSVIWWSTAPAGLAVERAGGWHCPWMGFRRLNCVLSRTEAILASLQGLRYHFLIITHELDFGLQEISPANQSPRITELSKSESFKPFLLPAQQ